MFESLPPQGKQIYTLGGRKKENPNPFLPKKKKERKSKEVNEITFHFGYNKSFVTPSRM